MLIRWLQKEVAEGNGWEIVWLKGLASELESEDPGTRSTPFPTPSNHAMDANLQTHPSPSLAVVQKPFRLTADLADRLLIARLEIDSQAMSCVFGHLRLSQC